MNERVHILRESVVKITQMLTGKGIKVTQQGIKAYVESDKHGRPIRVNLPYLPDNATEGLLDAIQGFLDHEVAHILFTDFSVMGKAQAAGVQRMTNILEDPRIEKRMAERFRGSGSNLATTGQFFLDNFVVPELEKAVMAGDAKKAVSILTVPMIRAMSGQEVFQEFMKDKWTSVAPIYEKIKHLQPKIEAAGSTQDCFDLAVEIKKCMESESEGDEGEDDSGGDSGSESSAKSSAPNKEGEGDKEERKDKTTGPDKNESKEKDKKEEKGAGDQEEEAKQAAGADAKGEGGEEGEEGAAGAGAGDGEEGEDKGEAEGDGQKPTPTKKAKGKPKNDEIATLDSAGTFDEIERDASNGFDEAMSRLITAATVEASKEAEYLVYTKDKDVVEELKVGGGYNSKMLESLSEKVDHMVGPLQKDLERAIAARSLASWSPGHKSGKLHAANLSRLRFHDPKVFRRKEETATKDVAVEMVIDMSGSMAGHKIHTASQAAYALSSVLERIGIAHEVICFTTGSVVADWGALLEAQKKLGRNYSRVEQLYMPILKTFQERLSVPVRQRFAWLPNVHNLRNNIDGECVEIAARRLMARRENGKIMIVLSDGAPAGQGNSGDLASHLKRVVKNVEKAGVRVVGMGINSDAVRHYYPRNMVINNVNELPGKVMKELRHLLVG